MPSVPDIQAAVDDANAKANSIPGEKRRLSSELTATQKTVSELKSRISNMKSISALNAKASAEDRAAAMSAAEAASEQLKAEQEMVAILQVMLLQLSVHLPIAQMK